MASTPMPTSTAVTSHVGTSLCSRLVTPKVPGAIITSLHAEEIHGIGTSFPGSSIAEAISVPDLSVCDINVTLTHPGTDDEITFQFWLPLENWNERFQAVGGGGFAAGVGWEELGNPAAHGFAVGTTDGGGLGLNEMTVSPEVLGPDGQIDLGMLADFSARALHELAVVGKAVTANFYGKPPHHSYWAGCSTGGRQGYMMAQRYPADFDGILAHAPAVRWPSVVTGLQWPQVLMDDRHHYPSSCEWQYLVNATIAACDGLDGVTDGIIADPYHCPFDPHDIVGQFAACDDRDILITQDTADLFQQIHDGPVSPSGESLAPGLAWGTTPSYLAATLNPGELATGVDLPLAAAWISTFLEKDPLFDLSSITIKRYTEYFGQAWAEYGGLIGTANPDLSQFRDQGGKLLTWHGLADGLLPAQNTILYRDQVERVMGGPNRTDAFYRLFLAPGVDHCLGGHGPVPVKTLNALVAWVEQGKAPDVLQAQYVDANGRTVTQDICRYPLTRHYDGHGSHRNASSYSCQKPVG